MNPLRKIKDRLYYALVEKNPVIKTIYQEYADANQQYHRKHRLRSWLFMLSLNTLYGGKKDRAKIKEDRAEIKKEPVRLPFLEGAESGIDKRTPPIVFAKQLMNFDVISFDIFDTLLLRPFASPADLFMILGERLGCLDFMRIRTESEAEARNLAAVVKGNREVTIYDIYRIVGEKTGIDPEQGAQVEFETELELCFENPYMKRVYKLVKSMGKTLIAVSDMYLPEDMIRRLLEHSGYSFDEIFVSCEHQCSKRSGNLYRAVKNKMGEHRTIVHIGDNFEPDFLRAQEMGLTARHYPAVNAAGMPYRPEGMSALAGSAYRGIANAHLHNGLTEYSPCYEYGFLYGGLYILGYCHWIYESAKRDGVEKILFLSRDGEILRRVFSLIHDDMPSEYVYWSRIANIKYTAENNRDDFLTRAVDHRVGSQADVTVAELLDALSLHRLARELPADGLALDTVVCSDNRKLIKRFLTGHWQDILDIYEPELEEARRVFARVIGGAKKVAVVDVGWLGSGPLGVKYLVEEKWAMGCTVSCYLAASRHASPTANLVKLMSGDLRSYIFSGIDNQELHNLHISTNGGTNSIYFELFTQACYPSFGGYGSEGSLCFDLPEVENYDRIRQIHEGIYDFCTLYQASFKSYPFMFHISPRDAYLPFSLIIKDLAFIKKYFSDFVFARGVGAGAGQTVSDIGQIMQRADVQRDAGPKALRG